MYFFVAKETVTIKKKGNMEIVSIERKTFEAMVAKFDRFVSRMDAICHRHSLGKTAFQDGRAFARTIRQGCGVGNLK